jgi:hypothetical protein
MISLKKKAIELKGVTGVATPIRNHVGKVIAAVATAIPAFSTNDPKTEEIIRVVIETAKEISGALGFSDVLKRREEANLGRNKRSDLGVQSGAPTG